MLEESDDAHIVNIENDGAYIVNIENDGAYIVNIENDGAHILNMPATDRDHVEEYEAKLWAATKSALISAFFHKLTRFFGICAITWSTVVLLGGFAGDLPRNDFYVVAILLVLEVGRFGCILFFTQLVRKNLVHNSQNPKRLNYKDTRKEIVSLLRLLSPIGQILFVVPSFGLPLWRSFLSPSYFGTSNLAISMHLFYPFVMCNSMLVVLATLVSTYQHIFFFHASQCYNDGMIQRYFGEVMWRTLHIGLVQADDFDIFEFAFNVQAQDYRCNVQPSVVHKAYGGFFRYLLAHRMGLDILSTYLDSEDCFKRRAAANIVGFWCDLKDPNLKRSLPRLSNSLLENLLHKMETRSQIGWDAAISLMHLLFALKLHSSETNQKYLYKICKLTSRDGKDVVEFLTDKLDPMDQWSISYLRLLAALLCNVGDRNLIGLNTQAQEDRVREILRSRDSRARTKMYAAYALLKAGKTPMTESIKGILDRKEKDSYFHDYEVYMLDRIREECNMVPLDDNDWKGIEMRGKAISPFMFQDKTPLELSSSVIFLRNIQTYDSTTSSQTKSEILARLSKRVLLVYQHLWARGATNHEIKKV